MSFSKLLYAGSKLFVAAGLKPHRHDVNRGEQALVPGLCAVLVFT
jgi:hypothetical protein